MRRSGLVLLVLLAALVVAGCASPGGRAKPHRSPAHSPAAAPSNTPSAAAPAVPSASPTAALPPCQAATMSAQMSNQVAVGNHQGTTVVLHNGSSASCSLDGYPTLTLTTGTANLPTSQVNGNDGVASISDTPTLVAVPAGGYASFILQYDTTPSGSQSCPQASWLRVQLPGGSVGSLATTDIAPCGGDLFASPFQAGTATA